MKPEDVTPELLAWLKATAENTAEFVQREAPLVANEIVAWHFWSSIALVIIFGVFASVMLGAAAVLFRIFLTRLAITDTSPSHEDDKTWCYGGLSAALLVLGLIFPFGLGVCPNIFGAVKASVAPRLVIIESMRGLTK